MKKQVQMAALCLAALAVGCGEEKAARPSLTKAEFQQKANEACYEANSKIIEGATRAKRLEKVLVQAIAARETAFRDFSKLHPPVGIQSDFVAFKQAVVARNEVSHQLVEKLRRGDVRLGRLMDLSNTQMARARELSSRLRLDDCPVL